MEKTNSINSELNSDDLERYSRHLVLPEIGRKGQEKLKSSSVLCIGCGGLGSPLLMYLSAAGVGHIGLVDSDLVEKSNLQRQIIHGSDWIGKEKTFSAKSRIHLINPNCKVTIYNTILDQDNALKIIDPYDVICDCTDNFKSRYLINDASVILGKPNIYGAIQRFEGHSTVFNLTKDSPNLRDFLPSPPPNNLLPSCSEAGVLGILPGIIGLIQATETIKIITNIGEPLDGRIVIFDALRMKFKELTLYKDNTRKPIKKLSEYKEMDINLKHNQGESVDFIIERVSAKELKHQLKINPSKILLVDVRTDHEFQLNSIKESTLIPLENIRNGKDIEKIKKLSAKKKIYIYCEKGTRSIKAILLLKRYGINAINVDGGISAWSKEEFPN
ncbi:molybdopterin-synthase adenylyltransferase MoeB [Prochlorococcus marinus]|uniref:molybdopterin-synthase adenylyltransferase MoeB n=1 Tax=Prochlorococcus marinus TaxID=1219 RepID=UPI0022B4A61B|nr:molybdopterin-synthase adenylyltransferase MoeB [Prochlorococcus marinus]